MRGILIFALLVQTACIESFDFDEITVEGQIVVDGFITDEVKQHSVMLYYVGTVGDSAARSGISQAEVILNTGQGQQIPFLEEEPGVYLSPSMSGIVGETYQLMISTEEGQEIQSDVVTFKATPTIDTLYGEFTALETSGQRGVQIYLDASTNSDVSFVRWSWNETYEVNSIFPTRFIWEGGRNFREVDVNISRFCWQSDSLDRLRTVRYESQQIVRQPIRFLAEFSPQLQDLYSIRVDQYALDSAGYLYWNAVRQITEERGSVFDVQAGPIQGNINCTNCTDMILGYFDAAERQSKRIFLSQFMFAEDGLERDRQLLEICTAEQRVIADARIEQHLETFSERVNIVGSAGNGSAWIVAPKICSDCKERASPIKPDFWP